MTNDGGYTEEIAANSLAEDDTIARHSCGGHVVSQAGQTYCLECREDVTTCPDCGYWTRGQTELGGCTCETPEPIMEVK